MIDPTKFPGGLNPPDVKSLLAGVELKLSEGTPNPADAEATRLLLDFYKREDGWHCPRCNEIFTDPRAFAQHIADEFNKAFRSLPTPTIK